MKDLVTAQSGWTLVEISVVLIVASIILPLLILPFVEGVRELELPVVQATLAFLVQGEMESRIVHFFDQTDGYDSIQGWGSEGIGDFSGYNSECTVVYVDGDVGDFDTQVGGDAGYKRISVTVTHGEYFIELVTVKTDWNRQT